LGQKPSRSRNEEGPDAFGRKDKQLLMAPHTLAALYQAKVPDDTIMSAAHSGDAAAFELQHPTRMHCAAIPSILAVHQISLRFLIRCQTANRKPRKLPAMIKR
jgi:hypothetical protein